MSYKPYRLRIASAVGILSLLALLPSTARAGCCVCGQWDAKGLVLDINKPTQVDVCYPQGSIMNQSYCNSAGTPIGDWGKIGTEKKGDFLCTWYGDDCGAFKVNSRSCIDKQGPEAMLGLTLKALNVNAPVPNVIKFKPAVSIPGSDKFIAGSEVTIDAGTLAEYITALYTFVVGSIGLLAVIGIMIGGFQYLIAAGAPDKISQAKESITSAVIGLIIALTSFLLLRTINVNLVDFANGVSRLTPIERQIYNGLVNQQGPKKEGEINACVNEEAAVQDFTAADFPNFQGSIAVAPGINAKIRWQVRDLLNNAATTAPFSGAPTDGTKTLTLVEWLKKNSWTLQINSAFRTSQKQFALRNCYEYSINKNICPFECSGCNEAASPSCSAPHQAGWAFDLCLSGADVGDAECGVGKLVMTNKPDAPGSSVVILQNYLQQASVGFRRYCREWWHFEHPGYGVTSCRCGPGSYTCGESGPSATGD